MLFLGPSPGERKEASVCVASHGRAESLAADPPLSEEEQNPTAERAFVVHSSAASQHV